MSTRIVTFLGPSVPPPVRHLWGEWESPASALADLGPQPAPVPLPPQ